MLQQHDQSKIVPAGHPLGRPSVQLLCYVIFGIAAPFLVWFAARFSDFDRDYIVGFGLAVACSTIASWYILLHLRKYAKARLLSYVVPVNLVTFGIVVAGIATLRAPYSSSLLIGCFLTTVATSYVLAAANRTGSRPQYVVTGGRVDDLKARPDHMIIQSPAKLQSMIEKDSFDGSFVSDLHHNHPPEIERLFAKAALRGIAVYHYRQIHELETGQVRIDRLSENVLGSLIPNLPYMTLKRLMDLLSVLFLAPLLITIMILIAVAIKMDSKGKVFFLQDRMGFRGEVFRMVKFRTMIDRTVEDNSLSRRQDSMTQSDDERVTRIGRFLRKMRLDELPQAWNILLGDMSWIGPRPEAISLSEWYENEIPFYSYRHIVRPGVTGWAQVNQGHVTEINDVTAKLRYDFYYVKNISHWLDMLIALKTVRVILGGFGAK